MPQVELQPCLKDNWIDENDLANKNGANVLLELGRQGDADNRDIIMMFDLSSIPPGSQVTEAVLWLYQTSCVNTSPTKINRILSGNADWSEGNSDWDDKDDPTNWAGSAGLETLGVDIASAPMWSGEFASGNNVWRSASLDPTDFQALLDVYNHGFKIWYTQRDLLLARANFFASKETGLGAAFRPKLIVTYDMPSERLVKYQIDIWDSERKILDSESRVVPPDMVDANAWGRLIGAGRPGSQVYKDAIEDPLTFYVESADYRGNEDRVKIRGTKESMMQAMLKKLGGVAT